MSPVWSIQIPEEKYLELKVILEKEHGTDFDIEDVREIADDLVELYFLLSQFKQNDEIHSSTESHKT